MTWVALAKALWVIFIIVLPFLGVFVYLIARGSKMHERAAKRGGASSRRRSTSTCGRPPAPRGADTASQLSKLADLKSQGVLTDAEFDAQKAKILAMARRTAQHAQHGNQRRKREDLRCR